MPFLFRSLKHGFGLSCCLSQIFLPVFCLCRFVVMPFFYGYAFSLLNCHIASQPETYI